jgi:hypothetical protein
VGVICDGAGMITKSLREMWRATPFVPFDIHMADGRKFHVPHPDFLLISPRGETIILVDDDEYPHSLSPLLIVSASPSRRRSSKKAR